MRLMKPDSEDHFARLRDAVQQLERAAALMDELDAQLDRLDEKIIRTALDGITGAGRVATMIKADQLSSRLKRLVGLLRSERQRAPYRVSNNTRSNEREDC